MKATLCDRCGKNTNGEYRHVTAASYTQNVHGADQSSYDLCMACAEQAAWMISEEHTCEKCAHAKKNYSSPPKLYCQLLFSEVPDFGFCHQWD